MNLEFDPNSLNLESLEESANENASNAAAISNQKRKNRLKMLAIGSMFFFVFLIFKLPEKQIQKLIVAHIKINTQKSGFTFNAEKVKVSLFFGPALKFYNAEMVSLNDDRVKISIPYFKIRPHLFSLLPFFKMKKVSIVLELGKGALDGTIGISPTGQYANISFDDFPIDSLTRSLLPADMSLGNNVLIDGKLNLQLDDSDVKSNSGSINLKLLNVAIPSQTMMGMPLPKISISESKADIDITEGKATIKTLALGTDLKKDDLVGNISGDATIGAPRAGFGASPLDRITLNVKADFQLSAAITKAIPLLDSILGSAKGGDGKYHYTLKGPLSSPLPTPAK